MEQFVSLNKYMRCVGVSGRSGWVIALWEFSSLLTLRNRLCVFNCLKRGVIALFGGSLGKDVVIKQGVRIKYPWKLRIGDCTWIGEDAWIDNIERVEIGSNVCISQGVYLCTGNHDWSKCDFSLIAKPIVIDDGVWVGAKALVGPGVHLGAHSVVTIGSAVTRDTKPNKIYQGNPAVHVKDRHFQ